MNRNEVFSGKYDEEYYTKYDCSPYQNRDYWEPFFNNVADGIIRIFNPRYVLDVGCAMGYLVEALRDRGVEAFGIDISEYAISNVRDDIKPFCFACSINEPLPSCIPAKIDVVTNIEVLEHLAKNEAEKAIGKMCSLSDTIVFSSSHDAFDDPSHINVQQREYWATQFSKHGFFDDIMKRPNYISKQAVAYRKASTKVYFDHEKSLWMYINQNDKIIELIQQANNELKQEMINVQQINDELKQEMINVQLENYSIYNSTSWKITKPIRLIKDMLCRKNT